MYIIISARKNNVCTSDLPSSIFFSFTYLPTSLPYVDPIKIDGTSSPNGTFILDDTITSPKKNTKNVNSDVTLYSSAVLADRRFLIALSWVLKNSVARSL